LPILKKRRAQSWRRKAIAQLAERHFASAGRRAALHDSKAVGRVRKAGGFALKRRAKSQEGTAVVESGREQKCGNVPRSDRQKHMRLAFALKRPFCDAVCFIRLKVFVLARISSQAAARQRRRPDLKHKFYQPGQFKAQEGGAGYRRGYSQQNAGNHEGLHLGHS
jgi:hypothetical protein